MSVQSSPAVRESSPPDSSFDVRWAAWIERGRQHDLALERKLRIALVGVAVLGLPFALFFFARAAGAR